MLTPKGDELYLLKDGPDRAPLSALLVHQTIAQQCGPASFRAGTKHKAHGVPFQPGDRVIPQGALVHRFPRLCTVIALGVHGVLWPIARHAEDVAKAQPPPDEAESKPLV